MRKLIKLLTVLVAVFAGYTIWTDPVVGPEIRAMIPENIAEKMPTIASLSSSGGGQATGTYGGIGAASGVAGAVVNSVSN